jgi:hypothetical protein
VPGFVEVRCQNIAAFVPVWCTGCTRHFTPKVAVRLLSLPD